ncbi:histidine kinase [Candidatus Albibeggiatoa sp. nov. NOAA]|uniref:sensor histidine kinase n=1 Tax=Candidatus Albibeggiatoa sp. nov. NOAA TaxID=3162724 RepID=UPI0032F83013|nr:histidine kinase [Thiotrichaceae bacterium]
MDDTDKHFLPNFCSAYLIISGIILTELLAIVLVLSPVGKEGYAWHYIQYELLPSLGWTSIFMQAVTLLSLSILCITRKWLRQLEDQNIGPVLSYLFILLITWVASKFAWELDHTVTDGVDIYSNYYSMLLTNLLITNAASLLILGTCYYKRFWKNSTLILIYTLVIIFTILFTELLAVLNALQNNHSQVIDHHLFLLRNLSISAIVSAIVLRYFYIQYRWKKQTEATAYSRVQALQARIRPHFLFNSMNTIASLIRIDPDKAEQAVEDLSELFRASLGDAREKVALEEELDLCIQYLRIEGLRLDERLQVQWKIDRVPQDALIPRLSIQPLLENAIYYGIQPLPEGGMIEITGLFDGKQIQLDIENPLSQQPLSHRSKGHGIAQRNIHERLQAHYGQLGSLNVRQEPDVYCVSLRFPYQTDL